MSSAEPQLVEQHPDLIEIHRFKRCVYHGVEWQFGHLQPFAFREEIEPGLEVDVVVFFSCHCFTHGGSKDQRAVIPRSEFYLDGNVFRVLNPDRYELSKRFMPQIVEKLRSRQIRVMGPPHDNYATFEETDIHGNPITYAVFFSVKRDRERRKRLIMRVESAYPIEQLSKKHQKAGKVNLSVLLKKIYRGEKIKP